jgi:hypothetical protein
MKPDSDGSSKPAKWRTVIAHPIADAKTMKLRSHIDSEPKARDATQDYSQSGLEAGARLQTDAQAQPLVVAQAPGESHREASYPPCRAGAVQPGRASLPAQGRLPSVLQLSLAILGGRVSRVLVQAHDVFSPMNKVARSLKAHRLLILNGFRMKGMISAATGEGFNNKAKLTMRKSYGFGTYPAIKVALYHTLGALPEPESIPRLC